MDLNLDRVRENVRKAATAELLDRVTVYRDGMEPAAIELIERELSDRGIDAAEIQRHALRSADSITRDGIALKCSYCEKPAVARGWGWHWLWGRIPVFPRPVRRCVEHMR